MDFAPTVSGFPTRFFGADRNDANIASASFLKVNPSREIARSRSSLHFG
jgi:hypothetical protein